jgi:hypothetical protein
MSKKKWAAGLNPKPTKKALARPSLVKELAAVERDERAQAKKSAAKPKDPAAQVTHYEQPAKPVAKLFNYRFTWICKDGVMVYGEYHRTDNIAEVLADVSMFLTDKDKLMQGFEVKFYPV